MNLLDQNNINTHCDATHYTMATYPCTDDCAESWCVCGDRIRGRRLVGLARYISREASRMMRLDTVVVELAVAANRGDWDAFEVCRAS